MSPNNPHQISVYNANGGTASKMKSTLKSSNGFGGLDQTATGSPNKLKSSSNYATFKTP